MNFIYELFYQNKSGEQIYCNTFGCEIEVDNEMQKLQNEFPENEYWYDILESEV